MGDGAKRTVILIIRDLAHQFRAVIPARAVVLGRLFWQVRHVSPTRGFEGFGAALLCLLNSARKALHRSAAGNDLASLGVLKRCGLGLGGSKPATGGEQHQ